MKAILEPEGEELQLTSYSMSDYVPPTSSSDTLPAAAQVRRE